ncbi:MAG TPA: hypothetical protein VNN55_11310 [bacterium]|nr:hypothetical protein [bacterium]
MEDTLDQLEDLLNRNRPDRISERVHASYTPGKRRALLEAVSALRRANEAMFQALELEPRRVDESQVVEAMRSYLWTVLEDSRPHALTGYGELSPAEQTVIERHVVAMLQLLPRLSVK